LLAARSFLFLQRWSRREHSLPGTNLIWYMSHRDTRGKACTYIANDRNSAKSSSSKGWSVLYTATTIPSDCAWMVAGMSTHQSREVRSGVAEAEGIAEALQWCLVQEINPCLVNLWPSGDVVRVNVMVCLVRIS
jgi:hypothetical protein